MIGLHMKSLKWLKTANRFRKIMSLINHPGVGPAVSSRREMVAVGEAGRILSFYQKQKYIWVVGRTLWLWICPG